MSLDRIYPDKIDEPMPLFTLHTDPETGREWLTVDYWPDRMRIDERVFRDAKPDYLRRDGDRVTITCENGQAIYRLGDFDAAWRAYPADAVARVMWGSERPAWLATGGAPGG